MRNSKALLVPALIAFSFATASVYAMEEGAHGARHGHSGHGYSAMGIISPDIHDKLQLNPAQEQTWQEIEARAKVLRTQTRDERLKFKEAFRAELAKPELDLAKLSTLKESMQVSGQQARKDIEAQQLNFYASLSAQQKSVVKAALLERMEHKDSRHKEGEQKG